MPTQSARGEPNTKVKKGNNKSGRSKKSASCKPMSLRNNLTGSIFSKSIQASKRKIRERIVDKIAVDDYVVPIYHNSRTGEKELPSTVRVILAQKDKKRRTTRSNTESTHAILEKLASNQATMMFFFMKLANANLTSPTSDMEITGEVSQLTEPTPGLVTQASLIPDPPFGNLKNNTPLMQITNKASYATTPTRAKPLNVEVELEGCDDEEMDSVVVINPSDIRAVHVVTSVKPSHTTEAVTPMEVDAKTKTACVVDSKTAKKDNNVSIIDIASDSDDSHQSTPHIPVIPEYIEVPVNYVSILNTSQDMSLIQRTPVASR